MSVFVAFGANLAGPCGSPAQAFDAAVTLLERHSVPVTQRSSLWESAPVPRSEQPWYVNAVVQVDTDLAPHDLLGLLHRIESAMGRVRSEANASRAIDLDLLAYHAQVIGQKGGEGLMLPHPRLHERAFVLFPLQEIAPNWIHPVSGACIPDMTAALDPSQEIRCLAAQ
ncbi:MULTISPECIES: 2-amino-4-hydroxy-6-hydroxymethyldihydropteridine diphosphokinase [unclassified Haematospirillum]|uniref:2-amino-4-hydroxy-6- hydroxymethyldihydropteridine diphosphokinase n=1 Tax=unclassified Haematospirillum TaxID=2622088 RepID=UPI00143B1E66|nr:MULTISPECIES: 2-amino-4-hydroxy-6-hydroxymethyldihydropteridine diphosphokinase [unclassified Haematospirillum]NKD54360.1 2-amino-4-hydroxy-6-hydroxymethyldihydropteridine diphosphokinase [Haematospirillum sp. H4890]NKD74404.1 2-amino-4-hydroxy-6-hydroxymethyldihydropteridine diphosphokinase [Haematospirillum sp. H4485]NKD86925.1 2-amino-4-hydroxy-6-hydroxymethyldihydropteridine diphosphokinase [Haematospirillum sp. 15-248]